MTDRNLEERLARLETSLAHMRDRIDRIDATLTETVHALERYRGAVGLFLFLISAIMSAAALFLSWLRGHN